MMRTIVPPGGFAGFSQMTQASQRALGAGVSRSNGTRTRKRRKASSSAKRTAKRAKRSGKRRTKLVKGSAAAKRFMANLRKRRKR